MTTRSHTVRTRLDATPEEVFAALITPSAIREWWSAARAIVMPERGGLWVAAWGGSENAPDYVSAATITTFDPPHLLALGDYRYSARTGPLPLQANFTVNFRVSAADGGAWLEVTQEGFPAGPEGDTFLAACVQGWSDTLNGLRRYLDADSRPHGGTDSCD